MKRRQAGNVKIEMDFDKQSFTRDGKPAFLITGEFPYYRVASEDWADRLAKVRDLGIEVVSCYIPWNLHEFQEGVFDFNGSSHFAQRDVKRFGRLVAEAGLKLIAKPGPFICAEYRRGAIPEWLAEAHPEVLMRNANGQKVLFPEDLTPLPSYLEPTYLSYVRRWYKRVTEEVLLELQEKDVLVAVQVENEIPYSAMYLANPFSWGYEPATVARFREFLKGKYGDPEVFRELTGLEVRTFDEVMPPTRPAVVGTSGATGRCSWLFLRDWLEFKEDLVRDVLRVYSGFLRENGITVPLYHDVVMLDNESPVNYGKMAEAVPLAVNFWLENHPAYDFRSYCRALARKKLLQSAQPERLCYSSESNWSWGNAKEFDFLFRSLLPGQAGMNIYCLVDGGAAGTTNGVPNSILPEPYPGQAPIDVRGNLTDRAEVLRQLTSFAAGGEVLAESREPAEVAVLNYVPYNRPAVYNRWGGMAKEDFQSVFANFPDMNNWLLDVIGGLVTSNIPFAILELSRIALEDLKKYKLVFAPGYDYMSATAQEALLAYVKGGGKLFVFPSLPEYDDDLRPCSLLKDAVIGQTGFRRIFMFHHFSWVGFGDVGTILGQANALDDRRAANPGENGPGQDGSVRILGRLASGFPVALDKNIGRGKIIFAGLEVGRLPVANKLVAWLLAKEGISVLAEGVPAGLHVVLTTNGGADTVFVVNRTGNDIGGKFTVYGPKGRKHCIETSVPAHGVNMIQPNQQASGEKR